MTSVALFLGDRVLRRAGYRVRPRLLFLTPVHPHPPDRGQNVRIARLLDGLRKDHEVVLVTVPPPVGTPCTSPLPVDHVVLVDPPRPAPALQAVLRVWRATGALRRPGTARALLPYVEAVAALGGPAAFDAVWVERLMLAPVAGHHPRTVVDLDDLEHRKHLRCLRAHARLPRHAYYFLRFLLAEVVGARRYAAVVVASAEDEARLRRLGVTRARTVGNGVDLPAQRLPEQAPEDGPARLVFLGNLEYPANQDALRHLCDDVLPLLQTPVLVEVVGGGAPPVQHPDLVYRGYVEDLGTALRRGRLMLAPLRQGGGTKLKVLDALAAGVPVVTTPVGVEGLGLQDGVDVLVATDARGLAAAVERLLADPDLSQDLARRARARVQQGLTWLAAQQQARAVVSETAAGR